MNRYLLFFATPTIFDPGAGGSVDLKAFSNRILSRPVMCGELFVDDGDTRSVG